jgi:hypothetical protein
MRLTARSALYAFRYCPDALPAYTARLMLPLRRPAYSQVMATIDKETVLSRDRLALDVSAIGRAMLEGDMEEARFRAYLLRSQASDLGLEDVAKAALMVVVMLPPDERLPKRGIGRAMLWLCNTLDVPH